MTDLDLLVAGAMVTFLAVSGAYIAIRHRANETPVDSYKRAQDHVAPQTYTTVKAYAPADSHVQVAAVAQPHIDARN